MSEPAIEHAEVPSGSGYRGFGADVNRPVLALCTAASAAPVLITLLAGVTRGAVSHIGDPVVAATAIAAAVLMAGLAFAVLHRMLVRPLQRVHRELADLTGSVQEASSGEDIPLRDELAPRGQAADDLPTLLATLHRVVETARGADARSENKCSVCDRRKAVRTMADTIQNGARVVADELADHGRAMMNHARQAAQFGSSCSKAIDDVLVLAQRGYDGSSATWDQICRLASAADGVARHVDDSREGTARVQSEVCDAQAGLSEAARFSQEIATSAARIRALAERIDLVALNAAIEAVRVGEAGKSFAVVAAEVQTLAGETAQVTDDLVEQVEALQMVTERTQTTFFGVGQTMGSLSGAVAAIDGQLQTQTGGLQAVREAMETAAAEAHQVVGRLGEMQQTSRTAQTMLDEVDDHAQVLVDAIIDLRKSLTRIVRTSVPEADLRRHPRVPVECPAVIVHDGQQHEGRLIDVSEGGAAVTTDASLPEGGRVQVAIPDAGNAIPGRIVGRDPEKGTLRIAFDQAGSDPVTALLARITR